MKCCATANNPKMPTRATKPRSTRVSRLRCDRISHPSVENIALDHPTQGFPMREVG